jgi:hypothetical protein
LQTGINNDSAENDSNLAGPRPSEGSFLSGVFTLTPGDEPVESGLYAGDGLDNAANTSGNMTVDFGFVQPVSIGNFVWLDSNANGIQDADEVGIPGVTVNLLDSDGNTIDSTETNSEGYYGFGGLVPGSYQLEFVAPAGFAFSPRHADDEGNSGELNSDAASLTGLTSLITLVSGEDNLNLDAGLYEYASISGNVSAATNNDGSGDSPLEGVIITLLDGNGDPVLDGDGEPITTTTDSEGNE